MHADEAERQRQRRGGQRAEDDEQDQRDDREAARLRFGQVFLGELLHPRPDGRLPGQVGGDASRRRCRGRGLRAGRPPGRSARRARRRWRAAAGRCRSRCSCSSRAAGDRRRQGDARRPWRPRAGPGRPRRPRSAALGAGLRPAAAPRSRSASLAKTPCIESATAFDSLPGTSKPPPVRCSVCFAAKGSAGTTIATQAARTQRRRRPRTPASRFIASRIGWLASLSHRRRAVCESPSLGR